MKTRVYLPTTFNIRKEIMNQEEKKGKSISLTLKENIPFFLFTFGFSSGLFQIKRY
jgi:hypothetical protein|nr:hypothetical protein [uncultured bacterium]